MIMNKLKEWLLWYFLIGAYIWGWCGVAGCILVPLILGCAYSPWWFLSWIATVPAAVTTIIVMSVGKGDKEE
jgi:hypothetical protein